MTQLLAAKAELDILISLETQEMTDGE